MNKFIRILAASAAAAVLMVAAAGAPALAQGMADDSECVKDLLSGEEFGLCNAYCEAMDCDSDTPQASAKACEKVASKFASITDDPIPCLVDQSQNARPVVDLNGPIIAGIDTTATFVSFGDAVPIALDVVITDNDGDVIVSATVTLTNSPDGLNETLSLTPAGDSLVTNDLVGGAWGFDSSSGVLTITGTGNKATYADILLEVVYDNTLESPNTTSRDVEVFVSDETDPSLTAATSVMAVAVGCPCPSYSSDIIINTALRAYKPITSARVGDCDSTGTNCYDSVVSCTRFDADGPIFFEYTVQFDPPVNEERLSSTFLVRAGNGICRLVISAERGQRDDVFIFAEKRAEDCRLTESCNTGTDTAPFEAIVDFTQAMDDACLAEIPRLRAILVDFWENPGGIARLPRCS